MRCREGWAPPSAQKMFLYYYWGYICFTILCYLLLCNKVHQLYIYIYISVYRYLWIYVSPPSDTSLPPFYLSRSPQSDKLSSYAI